MTFDINQVYVCMHNSSSVIYVVLTFKKSYSYLSIIVIKSFESKWSSNESSDKWRQIKEAFVHGFDLGTMTTFFFSLSLALYYTHTNTHTLSLSKIHTDTLSLSLKYTQTHRLRLYLSFPLSLSNTHTHTHTHADFIFLSLKRTHSTHADFISES